MRFYSGYIVSNVTLEYVHASWFVRVAPDKINDGWLSAKSRRPFDERSLCGYLIVTFFLHNFENCVDCMAFSGFLL